MADAQACTLAVLAAAALLLAGCGEDGGGSDASSSAGPTADATTSDLANPPVSSAVPSAPATDGPVIDISIAAGVVTPTNAEAQASIGEPIVLAVSSDVADQLHVHSVPEYTFDVAAMPDQRFEFTVDVPGRVDVELHDLNRTVVTIQVRP